MTCVLPRIPRLLLVSGVLALTVALLAMSCGGEAEAPTGDETPPTDGSVAFDVSMGDNFFQPKDLTVKAGQQVTLNLKNDGAAAHTFRFAGPDNQYNSDDDVISDPFLINAGDSQAVIFTAPEQPGAYDFKCEVHPPDQVGTITVQ